MSETVALKSRSIWLRSRVRAPPMEAMPSLRMNSESEEPRMSSRLLVRTASRPRPAAGGAGCQRGACSYHRQLGINPSRLRCMAYSPMFPRQKMNTVFSVVGQFENQPRWNPGALVSQRSVSGPARNWEPCSLMHLLRRHRPVGLRALAATCSRNSESRRGIIEAIWHDLQQGIAPAIFTLGALLVGIH